MNTHLASNASRIASAAHRTSRSLARKLAVVALPLALIAVVGMTVHDARAFDLAGASQRARSRSIQPGDQVVITAKSVSLQIGTESVARVTSGMTMKVVEVKGDWVGGQIAIDGAERTGWLPVKAVAVVRPDATTVTKPAPPTEDQKPAPAVQVAADKPKTDPGAKATPKKDLSKEWNQVLARMKNKTTDKTSTSKPATTPAASDNSSKPDPPKVDSQPKPKSTSPTAKPPVAKPPVAATPPATPPSHKPATPAKKPVPPTLAADEEPVDIQLLLAHTIEQLEELERGKRIGQLTLIGDQFSDRSLKYLNGLYIRKLSIDAGSVTNSALKYCKEISGLRFLRLWSPRFSDGVLPHLTDLKELEVIDLEGSGIEGYRLELLASLPKLHGLVLSPVTTDATIDVVAKLPHIDQLDLRACGRLSEAVFGRLAEMKSLQKLWLPSQIARRGRTTLRKQMPDCVIQ